MLLFNDQHRVSSHDDEVDFTLSTLFDIRYANRFKDVPAVGFSSSSTDFCKTLFGQLTRPVNLVGGMKTPTFSPPFPA